MKSVRRYHDQRVGVAGANDVTRSARSCDTLRVSFVKDSDTEEETVR